MANEIISYMFEGHNLRTVSQNGGDLWFVLADVCAGAEIGNSGNVAARLDDDEKGIHTMDTLGGPQEMLIVSEPGLYKVLQRSNKPEAKRFDRWIRHEVMPSIRKYGCYPPPANKMPQEMSDLMNQLRPVIREEVHQEVEPIARTLALVVDNTKQILEKGRNYPTAETIRVHGKVIRLNYNDLCPCMECDITIMDADGFIEGVWEHHHQNGRHDNSSLSMIPLAKKCHKRITNDPEARRRFAIAFDNFQRFLARLPFTQFKLKFD